MRSYLDVHSVLRVFNLLAGAIVDCPHSIEVAARRRAIEKYPLDPLEERDAGLDGCPPAAIRHRCAARLVAELATSDSIDLSESNFLDWDRAGDVMVSLLGATDLDRPEPPKPKDALSYECGLDVFTERMVDFAIRLVADESDDFPQIASRVIADFLFHTRGESGNSKKDTLIARARRALEVVAVPR